MQRRDFIKVVAGSAITWPLAAHGQQPALPVIGFVHASSPAQFGAFVDAFAKDSGKLATLKVKTLQSNFAGLKITTSAFRHL
jgi:hypothetical protein